MKWLLIIGLVVAGWGLWYTMSDTPLRNTNSAISACQGFTSDLDAQIECAGNAFSGQGAAQNWALVAIVLGVLAVLIGGAGMYSKTARSQPNPEPDDQED